MDSTKAPHCKKVKKKQVKDELDRIKQAEKKRRRLEKALATSAAIRSELEKKKQMKKEEQQRLDDEGAAIAEAVALHVLLGEDSDDTSRIVLKKHEDYDFWQHSRNLGLLMDHHHQSALSSQNLKSCSFETIRGSPYAYEPRNEWNHFEESNPSFSASKYGKNFDFPYFEDEAWNPDDISAGLIAAQAVSSLQI